MKEIKQEVMKSPDVRLFENLVNYERDQTGYILLPIAPTFENLVNYKHSSKKIENRYFNYGFLIDRLNKMLYSS